MEDRCALLRLLISLCAESAQLHDTLHGEEDEVGAGRRLAGFQPAAGCCGCLRHALCHLTHRYQTASGCCRHPAPSTACPAAHPLLPPPLAPNLQLREKKKEITSLRQEVKRVQQEMSAQQNAAQQAQHPGQQAQQQGGGAASPAEGAQGDAQPPAAGPQQGAAAGTPGLPPLPPQRASARRARDLPAELEAMVTRISKLEQDMNQVGTGWGWGGQGGLLGD